MNGLGGGSNAALLYCLMSDKRAAKTPASAPLDDEAKWRRLLEGKT